MTGENLSENIIATLNGNKFYSHLIRDLNLIVTKRNDKIFINLSNMVNSIRKDKKSFQRCVSSNYFINYLKFYINLYNIELEEELIINTVSDLVELLPELFFSIKSINNKITGCYGPLDFVDFILFKIKPEYSYQVHNLLQTIQDKADITNKSFIETLTDEIDDLRNKNKELSKKVFELSQEKADYIETLKQKEEDINNLMVENNELYQKYINYIKKEKLKDLTKKDINEARKNLGIQNITDLNRPTALDKSDTTSVLTLYISKEDLKFTDNNIRIYFKTEDKDKVTELSTEQVVILTLESKHKILLLNNFKSKTQIIDKDSSSFLLKRVYLSSFLEELINYCEEKKFDDDLLLIIDEFYEKYINQTYIKEELDKYYIYIGRSYRKLLFMDQKLGYIYKGQLMNVTVRDLINCRIRDYNNRSLGNITRIIINENKCKISYK